MTQEQFIRRGRPRWEELERLLWASRSRGVAALPIADVRRLGELYRLAAADLAHARTFFPAAQVTGYLNRLVGEAHGVVYAPAPRRLRDLLAGAFYGWPVAVRRQGRAVLLAAALLSLGGVVGAVAARVLPELARGWLPEMFQSFAPDPEMQGGDPFPVALRPLFSAGILVNNLMVGVKAFGFGLSAGVGTVYVLVYNGLLLGVLASLAHQAGAALPFWSLILPHGVLELTAIAVMGGAGLVLGGALIDPGRRTRRQAVVAAAREGLLLVLAAGVMLAVAAAIEGFLTPITALSPWLKVIFGFAVGAAALAWLLGAGAGRAPGAAGSAAGSTAGPTPGSAGGAARSAPGP